ncbi:hypothetical protein LJC27_02485 [Christensenellaceae bacterium OttesenSCG-928-M15]|nr:hypothetical protein [Christensenellaceae bacterium OttesenSCG-928-M15]
MSEEKKNLGAPSSDETSALFVSARKKQLAQQEEEKRRQEEEEKRLAAEAEVQRLEEEVMARKRAAEEEARRIEEERARAAKDQQFTASKAAGAVSSAFGSVTKAVKSTGEKAQQPVREKPAGGAAAKKLNPKLLAVIGAAVVVVVVAIVLIVSGGGSSSEVFSVSMNGFAAMSASDQEAYMSNTIKYLEKQGYAPTIEERGEEAVKYSVKEMKDVARIIEDSGLGTALLEADGIPLTIAAYNFYDVAASEVHNLLKENIKYREFSAEEIEKMSLLDFVRLEGNEFVSALFAAENWLVEKGAMSAEHDTLMILAATTMQGTVMYVANQGGANATGEMGLLAAYGYMLGGDDEAVSELTGYPAGVFVAVPTVEDPLDTEFVVTAWGMRLYYPSSSFSVYGSSRNHLYIYPTSTAEAASMAFYFSENTISAEEDPEVAMSAYADEILVNTFGEDFQFESLETEFNNDEGKPTIFLVAGYYFDSNADRVDLFLRVGVANQKPHVTLIVAHPSRIDTYFEISENIRASFELL